jgi:hypothetical protein
MSRRAYRNPFTTIQSRGHLVLMLLFALMLSSCFQNQGGGGRRGVATTDGGQGSEQENPDAPDFSSNLNYLQNGQTQSTSTLTISLSFSDSLYLRGQQIDQFIRLDNASTVQCIVAPFPNAPEKKILVMAAVPRFLVNFSTNTREHYYLLMPANKESNQSFCQKTGLINQLDLEYNTTAIAYSLSDFCPTCFETLFTGASLKLFDPSGAPSTNVALNNLSLRLTNTPSSDLPSNASCTTSSECRAKGFDCCAESQCVRDRSVRSSVDQTSDAFMQALADIELNPSRIFNYSNFFHLCSQFIPTPDEPVTPGNPEDEERERFTRLHELFNCTTPIEGEMSICTKRYENASQASSNIFTTGVDDRNFLSTYTGEAGLPTHSITEVIYAGELLFRLGETLPVGIEIGPNNSQMGNDNLDDPLELRLLKTPRAEAPDDTLKISYKIDGSCERVSAGLAQCTKFYVQGQNVGRVDDHFPASNHFLIPYYADLNRNIRVEVDGNVQTSGSRWQLIPTSPAYIEFLGNGLQVFDTQKVAITYFVDTTIHKALDQKQVALDRIKEMCQCADHRCRLQPVKDPTTQNVTDYSCLYPDPDLPPPPLQQTVLMSSKTVPHLYFDETGVYQSNPQIDTPPQEGARFEYINNDLLRPNNLNADIGFNEIYGSFTSKVGSAKPAVQVRVERGKSYDIFVDSGSFSSCLNCGNDYFSSLKRLFPNSFGNPGGGYTPNLTDTDRTKVTDIRSDEFVFGRACFVPATMIPWSHAPQTDTQTQRLRRLEAQHFYYANGYKRDWFGFDYGSIIGSFDGVRWFSIGTQRRIRATTNRLFLAVNAYHGDLTQESTYRLVVSDASNIPASGSTVTSDFASDGAQCQQFHVCQTDRDCATRLGWEYKCETITNLSSPWPMFDANGNELPNNSSMERLQALFGATTGGARRCVYRSRGAACQPNLDIGNTAITFNQTTSAGSLGCNSNSYCQAFTDGGEVPRFNRKSARFGRSVANQNASNFVPESNLDTFGLGARIIGRPYSYLGNQPVSVEVLGNMLVNGIEGMCLPGRNPQSVTLNTQNASLPPGGFEGDRILGMGVSASGNQSDRYLNACSIFDTDGNYYALKNQNISDLLRSQTNDPNFINLAGGQVLPTNAMAVFESILEESVRVNFEAEQVTNYVLEENRCLRAPGSACHTDQDCAPNKLITDFLRSIDPRDASLHNRLNMYELLFWKENLVCGQALSKADPAYDLKNNRCCRETNQNIMVGTFINQQGPPFLSSTEAPVFNQLAIPGVDIALNNPARNSRMAPVRFEMRDPVQAPRHPPLEVGPSGFCNDAFTCPLEIEDLTFQFNTLDTLAKRTCCSGHWIRNWNREDNGGGHRWEQGRTQFFNKENLRCLNWIVDPSSSGSGALRQFTCAHAEEPDDPDCFARSVTTFQAAPILEWLAKSELLGIPQVAIEVPGFNGVDDVFSELLCIVNPEDMSTEVDSNGFRIVTPGFVLPIQDVNAFDFTSTDDRGFYYSARSIEHFDPSMRRIFSEDEFSCCLPAGTEVPQGTSRDRCCTGFINGLTNQCALPDFTNVSLYLNRYVSSEGSGLNDNVYDLKSGYIRSPSTVEQLACQKRICASGTLIRGVAHSPLKIRGKVNSEKVFRRFIDGNDESNNQNGLALLFEEGLRWNNHVYCAPEAIEVDDPSLIVVQCPQ